MKALLITLTFSTILILSSCGGSSDAGADANKLCECMEAAKQDPSRAEECSTMARELEERYEDDSKGLVQFAKTLSECMDTNGE
jgi:hypothetical protein